MRFAKKMLALMLAMVFVLGLLGNVQVDAKEITIATPKISVKKAKNEAGIKLTIGKTKDAKGYEVYLDFEEDEGNLYKEGEISYSDNSHLSCKSKLVKTIKLSGTKKRKVTIKVKELLNKNCKSLYAGKYTIKVRAYNNTKYDTTKYSEFSEGKSVKIKTKKNEAGYKSSYDFSSVKKGDVIKFGTYEQDGNFTNGREPIQWVVLKKTKSQIFMVSKYILDRLPYNKQGGEVTWDTCSLRKWLNTKFYYAAFNETEQGMIKTTKVENYDNAFYGTDGGEDTRDRVFLLSQLEMIESDYGFAKSYDKEDKKRRCTPSVYARTRGVICYSDYRTKDKSGSCTWWLRSPGSKESLVCHVCVPGNVDSNGVWTGQDYDSYESQGVRPAMVINLKS